VSTQVAPAEAADGSTAHLAGPGSTLLEQMEQLQGVIADLMGADDIDDVLERIVHHAGRVVPAQGAVAVVQLPDEHELRVAGSGVADRDLDTLVAAVRTNELAGDVRGLCVPLRSPRRAYGHLAVLLPAGIPPTRHDHRLLASYAGHVAAALDGAVALDLARRNHATAEALLDLARSLATAQGSAEVCQRLVEAVPVVTGADRASVWFFDAGTMSLAPVASLPHDPDLAARALPATTMSELEPLGAPQPAVIHADTASPLVAADMRAAGALHAVTVPLTAHGAFLGAVVAGYTRADTPDLDHHVLGRLQALADQAAAAVENARLLDQVRHQAIHDELTGLPTRRLMEDRATQALALARRSGSTLGLLFVDLDHFKQVNDTLGHAAGDALIRAVGERLVRCVRSSDTVARHGGDELVVLLPNLPRPRDAQVAALKILRELGRPFAVAGHELSVSASVGVSTDTGGRVAYDELLHRADVAMYEAKAQGRNTFAVHRDHDRAPSPLLS
jgi:diguanylate cyclase (GGDEF)-like protein